MLLTLKAGNALEVANELACRTTQKLSKTGQRLYTALCATALEVMQEKQYSPNTTEVTFFAPAESVALAVGIHPATLYRKLHELHAMGLVHCRGHACTHNGKVRQDGSLWAVRLAPRGSAAKVGFSYLKKSWRCLGADIAAGNTAYQQMRESYSTREKSSIRLDHILRWALSTPDKTPLKIDSRVPTRVDLEKIFDVPAVRRQDRADTIFEAALAMSNALQDDKSQRFFMMVLWNLLKLRDGGGGDYFAALHLMVRRVEADLAEGFARSGFALLFSRLKQAPWFANGMNSPPNRVETLPKN
jgi:hypothetical protein